MSASIAANTRWARTADRAAATAPAREALSAKFETIVDPDGRLSPEERARRGASLRRAHMTRLALRSAQNRRAAATVRKAVADSRRVARELARAASELDRLADDDGSALAADGGVGEA